MILADTNYWFALTLSKHVFHNVARDWHAQQRAHGSVLFCRPTQMSLLRLLTTEAVMKPYDLPAMTNSEAWGVLDALGTDRRIGFQSEPSSLEPHWKRFTDRKTASPKLWMDAYLAAFAIAAGHQLITTDHAFKQFHGLDAIILVKA